MFVVLTKEKRKNRLRQLWSKNKGWEERGVLGSSFAVVFVGKKTNWQKLQKQVGRYACRIVAPKGLQLPQSRIWRAFSGDVFEEKLLENTMRALVSSAGSRAENITIGVVDLSGKRQALVKSLLLLFPQVRVYCPDREEYRPFAQEVLEEYGAPLAITQQVDGLCGCHIVAALEEPPKGFVWDGLLVTTKRWWESPAGKAVQGLRPAWPEEMNQALPKDIDPMNFLCALLELGHSPHVQCLKGEYGIIDGEEADWDKIVEEAKCILNK